MRVLEEVRSILLNTLNLNKDKVTLAESTFLLGNIPELDSMAVISVISAIEEHFDIKIEDDEINAETFETVASLIALINKKMHP
jgi:acyl carrier protein